MSKKENLTASVASMTSKQTETKKTKIKEEGVTLNAEDLRYLKMLNMKTTEIKSMIGDLEITKARLLGDFNQAIGAESDFVNQLYSKYGIDEQMDFSIDRETGLIKYVK